MNKQKYLILLLLLSLVNMNSVFFARTLSAEIPAKEEAESSVEKVEYSTGSGGDTQPEVIEEKVVKVEKNADKYGSVPKILIGAVIYVITLPFRLIGIIFSDNVE